MKNNPSPFIKLFKIICFIYIIAGPICEVFLPKIYSSGSVVPPLLNLILNSSWIVLVFAYLYNNWDWLYFFVNKTWMWITNANVEWALNMDFEDYEINDLTLETIFKKILLDYPEAKSWHSDNQKKIIEMPFGCNIVFQQIEYPDSMEKIHKAFSVKVSQLNVPFNRSNKILDELTALIDKSIKSELNPKKEKYTFKLRFGESNPYFGLWIKKLRIPQQSLVQFNIILDELVGRQKERVEVNNKTIEVIANSLPSLQTLSKKYITLSAFDLPNS